MMKGVIYLRDFDRSQHIIYGSEIYRISAILLVCTRDTIIPAGSVGNKAEKGEDGRLHRWKLSE